MDSLLPSDPSNIDGYVIEGRLGSGGFGIVYGATSPDGRSVAVKVLRPELSDDPRLRERLAREADALSRVEGERTAEIFEVVTEGDLVYLVMERVEGESLTDQVNDGGALSGPMLWFAATGLVQALQEIHAAGIVHRDLKPSNVMYGPDGVKVLDFGISVVADETSLTQTGAFVGTGAWMAPEMVLGNDITEKTDVYALGLVLAFIALGAHPFGEGRADALMYRILNTDPDLDGIPAPFIDAVSMCLQRDPDDRPTLDELGRFFGSNGEQQLSATSIVGSDTGGTRIVQSAATAVSSGGNRRRNALIGVGVAAVLAVVGVIVGVTVGGGGDSGDLADGGDTQLEVEEAALVQDDEQTVEPVEAVVTEEPAAEEEPVAAEEPVVEETEEEPEAETVVEEQPIEDTEAVLIALLTDTYEWGSASASKTMMLQEALGLTTDGSYGPGTRQAHLNALQERGLTITNVPEEPATNQIIGCSLIDEIAEYPTVTHRINFTGGTPENYWYSVYMTSHNGQSYGPFERIVSGTNPVIDLSNEAQNVLPLNRIYIQANTLGQSMAWEGNPPYVCVGEFFYEEFEEPAPPVFQSSCAIPTDLDLTIGDYLADDRPSFTVVVNESEPVAGANFMPPASGVYTRVVEIDGAVVADDGPFTMGWEELTGDFSADGGTGLTQVLPGETVTYTVNATVTIEWDTPSSGQLFETVTCSKTNTLTRP